MSADFKHAISAGTRYCAVFGHPVRHSASPAMQNAGLSALGLDWRYLAFDVDPENLRQAIEGAKAMRFIGLNLTVPHKLLAMNMMDVLDESAKTWGAVNTIRFEGQNGNEWQPLFCHGDAVPDKGAHPHTAPDHRDIGLTTPHPGPLPVEGRGRPNAGATKPLAHLGAVSEYAPDKVRSHGFNTDAEALSRSLREDLQMELRGARVLLLGAGGAGRTAALKLADEKVAELYLVNRTPARAEAVAAEIRQRRPDVPVKIGYPKGPVELVLNATSLGLKLNDASPLDETRFSLKDAGAVYDMIYRPAETPLLRAAKAAGCRAANGLGMLLYQGAAALEIWTGRAAPAAIMREALLKNVYHS